MSGRDERDRARLTDPERELAVTYAPPAIRPALAGLFALDERFGAIVASTTEPMIGLMRLAWWREALERLDHATPPAEPLLSDLARAVLPLGVAGGALAEIERGWATLLDGEPDEEAVARHGRERGVALFRTAAVLLGTADRRLSAAGEAWAFADLGHRHSDPAVRARARRMARAALAAMPGGAWERRARPLAALAVLARRDAVEGATRAQGSPRRVARMLALRIVGR